eukprot:403340039
MILSFQKLTQRSSQFSLIKNNLRVSFSTDNKLNLYPEAASQNNPRFREQIIQNQDLDNNSENLDQVSKDELYQQRREFEETMKLSAQSLSNKTEITNLVLLFKNAAFLDNQQICLKLVEYLRSKISQVSNEELAQVYASLVLYRYKDPKLLKHLEYLALRRIHGFKPAEITKILTSYSYLCLQGKCQASNSFIKTLEFVLVNKLHEFSINEVISSFIGLINLQKATEQSKSVSNQVLFQLYDQIDLENQDDDKKVKTSMLCELYYSVKNHEILKADVDLKSLEKALLEVKEMKPKDIFNVLTVLQDNQPLLDIVINQIKQQLKSMIPEEIIILLNLTEKHQILKPVLARLIEDYINNNLEEINDDEFAKLYYSIHRHLQAELSKDFISKMNELIKQKFPKSQAKSLPYLLPLIQDLGIERKQIREDVLKILRQKDFSGNTYILILGQIIEIHEGKLNEDFQFWIDVLRYVPMIQLSNPKEYFNLRASIQHLDDNIEELDFKDMLNYLEEVYEKHMEKIEDKSKEEPQKIDSN